MFLRRYFSIAAAAAMLIVLLAGCGPALVGAGVAPSLAQAQPAAQTQPSALPADAGITVMGTGQVSGTPDIARVTVGVETQNKDVKKAVADNNSKMTTLIAALKSTGIADKDIQTMNYSVYVENPQGQALPNDQGTPTNLIYHVTNQVQITVRDTTKLSSVLDEAVTSGANSIYGVSFDVADPTKLADQAREIAVADAKARAEKLAKLEGVTLGSVIHVEETSANPGPVFAAKAEGLGGGAPIESGSIQITVNLQVTYAIK